MTGTIIPFPGQDRSPSQLLDDTRDRNPIKLAIIAIDDRGDVHMDASGFDCANLNYFLDRMKARLL
jgi:hypothetical protein